MKRLILFIIFLGFYKFTYSQIIEEWKSESMSNGDVPKCIKHNPKYNFTLNNFLRIKVGGKCDAIIKLINYNTGECIRIVFVKANNEYEMKYIPEGKYYVKVAFGNDYKVLIDSFGCQGRFFNNTTFFQGTEILDYFLIKIGNKIQVPSYEIILETKTKDKKNRFNTEKITEEEFYNE